MAYQVYLFQSGNVNDYIELDCEGVDFSTTFAVSQVADIANRTDSITKQIRFKGTKTNNIAFGTFFHQNVVADFELDNRLFFNYNPLRKVDCLIYEDSALLLRGELMVIGTDSDANGNPIYETVITGSFINFKETIQTLSLDDLDFFDLKHRYTWNNIKDSWELRTERNDGDYYYTPFETGSGYVYPFIDYGNIYKDLVANTNLNSVPMQNFRPAIFVKEYFDRIFNQEELAGYTYEVMGSPELIDRFNSLIIPCNLEKLTGKGSVIDNGMKCEAISLFPTTQSITKNSYSQNPNASTRAIVTHQITSLNGSNAFDWYGKIKDEDGTSYIVKRTFTSNGYCKVKLNSIYNKYTTPTTVHIQLCEREFIEASDGSFSDPAQWKVVTSKTLTLPAQQGLPANTIVELEVGEREFVQTTLLCLRIVCENPALSLVLDSILGIHVLYNISDVVIRFPKDDNSLTTYEINDGDEIVPEPVKGIKQMDFIKSVIQLMNFYVYTEKERPKHLLFSTWSDYYSYSSLNLLATNSVDWTAKIDYSKPPKGKPNIDLPKSYLFTFKDDEDFINKDYKTKYSEPYGTFRFNDSYGLKAEKKVELIFSPSPLFQYKGTGRVHPIIHTTESGQKKPTKSNIRIMYYNGVKSCQPYIVGKDFVTGSTYSVVTVGSSLNSYAQVGNYYLGSGLNDMTPQHDLYFGQAKLFYFDSLPVHQTCPTGYQMYYREQITELTKPNISFVNCQGYLNEVDIANINLRKPVFVDFGKWGHHYYKVHSVEYHNKNEVCDLQLQKITV